MRTLVCRPDRGCRGSRWARRPDRRAWRPVPRAAPADPPHAPGTRARPVARVPGTQAPPTSSGGRAAEAAAVPQQPIGLTNSSGGRPLAEGGSAHGRCRGDSRSPDQSPLPAAADNRPGLLRFDLGQCVLDRLAVYHSWRYALLRSNKPCQKAKARSTCE
jgi:hypothetical protein